MNKMRKLIGKNKKVINIGVRTKRVYKLTDSVRNYVVQANDNRSLKTAQERIEFLNGIMYKNGYPKRFFQELFNQDARLSERRNKHDKTKYINLFPTTSQPLSHELYDCKCLEQLATFILEAPDQPRMNKQQEYTFYNERDFKKLISKEVLYEGMVGDMLNNGGNFELNTDETLELLGEVNHFPTKHHLSEKRIKKLKYIDDSKKMAFLKREGENYRKDGRVKVTKKDVVDPNMPYLKIYEDEINRLTTMIKKGLSDRDRWIASQMIGDLRQMQVDYKNYKKGTIVFKQPLKDSTKTDYDTIDFFDKRHVLTLLNMPKQQITDDNDLSLVLYDLEILLKKINIREEDLGIVNMYRNGFTQDDIAKELNISQSSVSQVISKLANSVIKEYELIYEDWYYLNKVKGKYKQCSRCGEIKLTSHFSKHSQTKDKLRPNCKKCDNKTSNCINTL